MRITPEDLSVIIPAYNEEENIITILRTLDKQSLEGFSVIVVDDGSLDNTATLVEMYEPKQFTLHLLKQDNKGAARARETAIRYSKSKYIAVIDSDDSLADDSLEKAFKPLVSEPFHDISLFNLSYVDSIDKNITDNFICYTPHKKLKGVDVFSNCIRSWGVHAFGIYNRIIILTAYESYNNLNKEGVNYLNNDEVISRISFDLAKTIFLSDGDYFFVNNTNSTTRRINHNYYKVMHNAFFLLKYIEHKTNSQNKNMLINDAYALIISTIWGVSVRYFKWYKSLTSSKRAEWRSMISHSVKLVIQDQKVKNLAITKKNKLQLILLGVIF
ncbi:glycosyltransferase family 2 protein [Enterobacter bugandensis]|uniref:glycosyltransferase family 2 protein n=1 Tax=Enterobacter bugandensis TaxID=881260 RepID=UPI00283AAFC0|nr:glycosyltransferase family 2 protein [Enterobacter bugandensis]WMU71375.1 glycosyltransferase family 2 protein [Enterobacter bugandensis]